MKRKSLKIGDRTAAQRMVQMVGIEYGYRMENSKDGNVTPRQIALVLRALADHTTLMYATSYERRSLAAIREGRDDEDEYWPTELSVGRFLQDTAQQLLDEHEGGESQ